MPNIVLKKISKEYNGHMILRDINLVTKSGEIIAIKGKSGAGKSTLLNIIAGLENATSGEYFLDDINMREKSVNQLSKIRGRRIGYVSQYSPMIPNITVIENISISSWLTNTEINSNIEEINKLAEMFEINDLLYKRIETLSGGEIQRVGIIRALINNKATLIVADEPTGSLDDETTSNILYYFNELKSKGVTIIIATHSSKVAEECDQVYLLTKDGLKIQTVKS